MATYAENVQQVKQEIVRNCEELGMTRDQFATHFKNQQAAKSKRKTRLGKVRKWDPFSRMINRCLQKDSDGNPVSTPAKEAVRIFDAATKSDEILSIDEFLAEFAEGE